MLGTSLSELIFIRISAFLLRYSIPCSLTLLFAIYAFAGISPLAIWGSSNESDAPSLKLRILIGFLSAIFVVDTGFFLGVYLPFKSRASQLKSDYPRPPLSPEDRWVLFRKCLDNAPDLEDYLCRWFLDANLADIGRENVREFLAWAFFDRDLDDVAYGRMSDQEGAELEGYVDEINRRLIIARQDGDENLEGAVGLRPGRSSVKSLRTTIDDVPMCFRSVIWYIIVMLVDIFTHFTLLWKGFTYYATPTMTTVAVFPPRPQLLLPRDFVPRQSSPAAGMAYWYRPHTSRTARPVLFIHGIGIGLLPYRGFLSEVVDGIPGENDGGGQIGIIAVEILPICMRLAGEPLDKQHFLEEITAILGHHGWLDDGFTLVSHSYGSVLTTHLLGSPTLGPLIHGLVLTDPVSLLLHLPDVAYNFTRRTPRHANEVQLWFAASTDPGTALVLGRYFFWQQNIIWKEELLHLSPNTHDQGSRLTSNYNAHGSRERTVADRKVAVALAGRDNIIDTRRTVEYLFCEGDLAKSTDRHEEAVEKLTSGLAEGGSCDFTDSGIEVLYFPTLDHSHCFDRDAARHRIVRTVREYSKR